MIAFNHFAAQAVAAADDRIGEQEVAVRSAPGFSQCARVWCRVE